MKVWNNKQHEEVLRLKKMRRSQAEERRKQAQLSEYDTTCSTNNKSKEVSTATACGNRGYYGGI